MALLTFVLIQVARALLPEPAPPRSPAAASEIVDPPAETAEPTAEAPSSHAGDLRECCAALHQNAKSAPPEQKAMYLQAAAICDGLKRSPQGRAALAHVRAALPGPSMPKSCR